MPEYRDHLPLPPPESEPHRVVTGPRTYRPPPERNPEQHAARLRAGLARVNEEMRELAQRPRPPSSRGFLLKAEIVEGVDANVGGLGDKRTGSFVVDRTDDGALVHNQKANLAPLFRKISQYADPEQRTKKGERKNKALLAPLEEVRLATLADLSDGWLRAEDLDPEKQILVELWAGGGTLASEEHRARVKAALAEFLERRQVVVDGLGSFEATEHDIYMLELSGAALMELPTELPDVYRLSRPERPDLPEDLDPYEPPELPEAEDPGEGATAVAILDTGVAERHPLLEPAMLASGSSSIPGEESAVDRNGHGSKMAGLSAYGELGEALARGSALRSRCSLQNQRIFAADGTVVAPEFMLERTRDAVLEAETVNVARRVFNLSIGAPPAPTAPPGERTAWGNAIDQLAYNDGRGRLVSVAAGNEPAHMRPRPADYPHRNLVVGLASPGEAINAVTVGAVTDRDTLDDGDPTRFPLARKGQLCPVSRCDIGGARAIKPDVIAEGGNLSTNGTDTRADTKMQLLSTSHEHATASWIALTAATSAATAQVSGMLAEIWNANPSRWPQTIRGLLVHSARWSAPMHAQFDNRRDRLRAFGYGQPDADAAARSILERPTLILEQRIYPERVIHGGREMHFLKLPMPDAELTQLGDSPVEISVTLSYFMEPNENRYRRFESAGLRWALQRPLEEESDFRRRINRLERELAADYEDMTEDLPWEIGPQARSRGTVQSDRARSRR